MVEPTGNLTCQFEVGSLIFSNRDDMCTVEQDVCSLENRVTEETEADARIRAAFLALNMLALFLVRWNTLQPADGGKHSEEHSELSVLRDSALAKNRYLTWVKACGEVIQCHFT